MAAVDVMHPVKAGAEDLTDGMQVDTETEVDADGDLYR